MCISCIQIHNGRAATVYSPQSGDCTDLFIVSVVEMIIHDFRILWKVVRGTLKITLTFYLTKENNFALLQNFD